MARQYNNNRSHHFQNYRIRDSTEFKTLQFSLRGKRNQNFLTDIGGKCEMAAYRSELHTVA